MESETESPTCACGGQSFQRVVVGRAGADPYVTEFVACEHCRVMYHRPLRPRRSDSEGPSVDDWAARYRKSVRR